MRKLLWIGLLAGAALTQPSIVTSTEIIKPGLWEITTIMEVPGMPFQSLPQKVRHCVTQQEAKEIEKSLPISKDCQIIDFRSSANKINWKVECTGEMAGNGEGEVEYKGDSSYEGKTIIQTQGMIFHMRHKGKLVGKCP